MPIDYSKELNNSQLNAVMHRDGPCMVIAGAGSGKTRVLTYRIARLLEDGVEPWRILALTFTNKAAREMKERIASQVGERKARYLWMGTFHSLFARILRAEAEHLKYTHDFTIYDSDDSRSLIRGIIREMQLDDKVYKPNLVQNRISAAKNRLIVPEAYMQNAECIKSDQSRNMGLVAQIYQRYYARCRQADAMDFDDLLLNTFILFRDHPDVLERYSEQFTDVLVDEYQDTNYAQHRIIWELTRERQQICVVGDDAQSIYSFRGANIDNMLNFTRLYPGTHIYKLEQNYRSTQTIVAAANSLISKNRMQIRKEVYSENETGSPIKLIRAYSDLEEGELVSNNIVELSRFDKVPYSGMAVLYRTNAQSRILEESLRKHGIPYRIYGSLSFYQRKEIKDVIAYLRLAVNVNDEEAFKRVINYPARGLGQTTLNKLIAAASDNSVSLWNVSQSPAEFSIDINRGTQGRLAGFIGFVSSLRDTAANGTAFQVALKVIEEGGILRDLQADNTPEGKEHTENVKELLNAIDSFCRDREAEGNEDTRLTDWLAEVSLLTDMDNESDAEESKVTLMTVHAAKGLEFNTVFVVGMEEGLFPSSMCIDDERQIEEERRLFYVAITRAEKRCLLLYAMNRFRYGSPESSEPSRFLRDIDSRFLELPSTVRITRPARSADNGYRVGNSSYGSRNSNAYQTGVTRYGSSSGGGYGTSRYGGGQRLSGSSGGSSGIVQRPRNLVRLPDSNGTQHSSGGHMSSVSGRNQGAGQSLSPGMIIVHERFGEGEVLSVEGTGDSCKARIRFRNIGEKQLLLKYARFVIK